MCNITSKFGATCLVFAFFESKMDVFRLHNLACDSMATLYKNLSDIRIYFRSRISSSSSKHCFKTNFARTCFTDAAVLNFIENIISWNKLNQFSLIQPNADISKNYFLSWMDFYDMFFLLCNIFFLILPETSRCKVFSSLRCFSSAFPTTPQCNAASCTCCCRS